MIKKAPISLIVGISVIIILMVVQFSASYSNHQGLKRAEESLLRISNKTEHAYIMRELIRKRSFSLARSQTMDDYFDRLDEYDRFNGYGAEFSAARERLLELGLGPDERAILLSLETNIQKDRPLVEQTMQAVLEGERSPQITARMEQVIRAQSRQYIDLDRFVAKLNDLKHQHEEAFHRKSDHMRHMHFLFGGIIFSMVVVIAIVVIRRERHYFRSILTEITNRKRAEQNVRDLNKSLEQRVALRTRELQASEERFRDIAMSGADRFWEADESGHLTYFSPAVGNLIIPVEKMVGNTFWGVDPNTLSEEAIGQMQAAFESRESFRDLHFERRFGDGRIVHVRLSGTPVFDAEGAFKGYRGVTADETAEVAARQEAASLHKRFFEALDHLNAGVILWGPDHRLVNCNEHLRKLQANTQQFLVPGVHVKDYLRKVAVHGIGLKKEKDIQDWMSIRMASQLESSTVIEQHYKNGRWSRVSKQRLDDGSVLSFHVDITEMKQREADLKEAMFEADAANRAKSEFLSSMSHELRTPMNAILGFAQFMKQDPRVPLHKIQNEHVDYILKGGQHLLELIDQVLELNKIEAGQVSLSFDHVTPRTAIDECLSLIRARADEEAVDVIDRTPQDGMPLLWTDATRFRQVLLNLLSNAVKYNRENGTVILDCTEIGKDMVRVSIEDTGAGIPEDKRDGLFKPFDRLGREAGEVEGTGIGLSITKQIVELLGGQIGYESRVGRGSTFWIDIPKSGSAAGDWKQPSRRRHDPGKNGNADKNLADHSILYIEDNPENVRLMESIVNHRLSKIRLDTLHNTELGLDFAKKNKPDLIILDANLSETNGKDALDIFRRHKDTNDIPVIALSAHAMPNDIERGLKAGYSAFLKKPINVRDVVEAIEETLDDG